MVHQAIGYSCVYFLSLKYLRLKTICCFGKFINLTVMIRIAPRKRMGKQIARPATMTRIINGMARGKGLGLGMALHM
jgi:hypothetical protein